MFIHMVTERSFLEDPEGTQEEIMNATYYALCEHGYADLTIQRIGEHFGKSKSLLYHHYDGKDDLLLDFLAFMLDEVEKSIPETITEDAHTHLLVIIDKIFLNESPDEDQEFEEAMVELRAQAAHDARYRDYFTEHDRFFKERLIDLVEMGIDDGTFRDVDPERVASFLMAVFDGTQTRRTTSNTDVSRLIRDELESYVETRLLATDPDT